MKNACIIQDVEESKQETYYPRADLQVNIGAIIFINL